MLDAFWCHVYTLYRHKCKSHIRFVGDCMMLRLSCGVDTLSQKTMCSSSSISSTDISQKLTGHLAEIWPHLHWQWVSGYFPGPYEATPPAAAAVLAHQLPFYWEPRPQNHPHPYSVGHSYSPPPRKTEDTDNCHFIFYIKWSNINLNCSVHPFLFTLNRQNGFSWVKSTGGLLLL